MEKPRPELHQELCEATPTPDDTANSVGATEATEVTEAAPAEKKIRYAKNDANPPIEIPATLAMTVVDESDFCVESTTGICVGDGDGAFVGDGDGAVVGDGDGAIIGEHVGKEVKDAEGKLVVGLRVGFGRGLKVLGTGVGCFVIGIPVG